MNEKNNISGAIVGQPAPELPEYDSSERDMLFEAIQRLKQENGSTEEIQKLEQQLDELLERE